MLKITNGKETITIPNDKLQKELSHNKILKTKYSFWDIEIVFVFNESGKVLRIVKRYKGGDESLDIYTNNSTQKNLVLLNNPDYNKFKKLYENMNNNRNLEKEAVVTAGTIIMSYEYYKTMYLEENPEKLEISDLFQFFDSDFNYNKYKNEIIEEAKKYISKIDK